MEDTPVNAIVVKEDIEAFAEAVNSVFDDVKEAFWTYTPALPDL